MNIGKGFSFVYGGKDFSECKCSETVNRVGEACVYEYIFEDCLKVTQTRKKYENYDAIEWVNEFENISDKNTEIISELFDAVFTYETTQDDKMPGEAWKMRPQNKIVRINAPTGSNASGYEFACDPDVMTENHRLPFCLYNGSVKEYSPVDGRSSSVTAPYFEVFEENRGFIAAVGWSGQWHSVISRKNNIVEFKSGIERTAFYLKPGEKIKTSSVVVLEYTDGSVNAHNKWRRLLKDKLSVMTKYPEITNLPLSVMLWGGMTTDETLDRINAILKNEIPVEYFWIDAGWYGSDTKESPDEFEGDWWQFVGDWRVNKNHHPNGLEPVAERVKESGKKFLLWFEPERAKPQIAPITEEHPEYFLNSKDSEEGAMLNMGDKAARDYILGVAEDYIKRLNLSCFRQDCNFNMCKFWYENDEENRVGITEIKYINGLYEFWDSLLKKFPNLLIDNCASGGRRLDFEALKRTVPLWRSDTQCVANCRPERTQNHMIGFNNWLTYSGTGMGRVWGDSYDFRSSYAPGIGTGIVYTAKEKLGENTEQIKWLKKYFAEYLSIRDYLSCDFYPLTEVSDKLDIWSAVRFDRSEEGDGIILAFRRERSNYKTLSFEFVNAVQGADYIFTDADTNESFTLSAEEIKKGIEITIPEKRQSRLIFYKALSK